MNTIEFTTDLTGKATLTIPPEAAARLPRAGRVRVILLTDAEADENGWVQGSYEQFLSDDSPEDQIYESLR